MIPDMYGKTLTYDFVSQEFNDVGESMEEDLSMVTATLSRNVLDESYDFEICIYGQDSDDDSPPIVQSVYVRVLDVFDERMLKKTGSVDPYRVLSLFDQRMLRLLMRSGIKIQWNAGEDSYAVIDPVSYQDMGLLFVSVQ